MKLFVGDLTPWTTEDCLWERFSHFGKVSSVEIIRDAHSGLSRRYGFVEMPRPSEARRAIRALDGADRQGLIMSVVAKQPCFRSRVRFAPRLTFAATLLVTLLAVLFN